MRSLNADNYRPSLVGLAAAMVLISAWLVWFFFVPIPIYETSQSLQLVDRTTVSAQFGDQALSHIRPGQAALLNVKRDNSGQPGTIPAVVMRVPGSGRTSQVELYAMLDQFNPISELTTGSLLSVEVEIEQIPLSTMVLRASGQFVDTPRVSQNPAGPDDYSQFR